MSQDLLTSLNQVLRDSIPIVDTMGVKFTRVAPGFAEAHAPLAPNRNHLGTMYAGVLFTVAEVLGGAIILATFDATKYAPILKDMRIDYRRPATTDVVASAGLDLELSKDLARTADLGERARFELVAQIHDTEGTLVAETVGTYQLHPLS